METFQQSEDCVRYGNISAKEDDHLRSKTLLALFSPSEQIAVVGKDIGVAFHLYLNTATPMSSVQIKDSQVQQLEMCDYM